MVSEWDQTPPEQHRVSEHQVTELNPCHRRPEQVSGFSGEGGGSLGRAAIQSRVKRGCVLWSCLSLYPRSVSSTGLDKPLNHLLNIDLYNGKDQLCRLCRSLSSSSSTPAAGLLSLIGQPCFYRLPGSEPHPFSVSLHRDLPLPESEPGLWDYCISGRLLESHMEIHKINVINGWATGASALQNTVKGLGFGKSGS